MCRTQCVLAFVALFAGLAHSWDIAVSLGDELVFYANGSKTYTIHLKSQNLTALAYDEVHNMMLYVDKQNDNDAVCGYNLLSMETKCFIKRVGSNIHSIAFDPATDTLYFTDTNERSINWISLKPGSIKNVIGNLLIKMDDRTPTDIAVDSCRGYIYWTNSNTTKKEFLERARSNGSERKVIDQVNPVLGLAVDLQTQKLYFIDQVNEHKFLNRNDLDTNNNLHWFLLHDMKKYKLKEMTVSNDYLYWMNSDVGYKNIWRKSKNASNGLTQEVIFNFFNETPLCIAASYKIKDQIQGLQDCEALSSLILPITLTDDSLDIQQTPGTEQTTEYSTAGEVFGIYGTEVSETSVCKCIPGYIGERCNVSVCENYCLQGDCSFSDEGLPKCRCNAGYSGKRCETSVCCGYCSNNGTCSLNQKNEPVCQCKGDYVGDRCEESDCLNYCIQGKCSFNEEGLPKCSCNAGFSGARCEVIACHSYCLNNGDCSLNEEDQPVCQCVGNHEGTRCETVKNVTLTYHNISTYYSAERNLTLADLLLKWRKPTAKVSVIVEV